MKSRLFIISQYLLPHHLLSRLAGCIAECRVRWFKNAFTAWFAKNSNTARSKTAIILFLSSNKSVCVRGFRDLCRGYSSASSSFPNKGI